MLLEWLVGCGVVVVGSVVDCTYTSQPEAGEWTEPFTPHTDALCPDDALAHSLYDGRAVSANAEAVTMEFRKTEKDPDTAAPSVDIHWWLLVATREPHDCADALLDPSIVDGVWRAGETSLTVAVPPATMLGDDELAPASASVYLVTGGSDGIDVRRWWQLNSLSLDRTCE